MALPKNHRLVLTGKITALLRGKGRRIQTNLFTAFYLPGNTSLASRFAVIVGAYLSKKAVLRNRIRRIVQEAIRFSLPKTRGIDMIVYPKKKSLEVSTKDVRKNAEFLLQKIA